MLTVLIWIILIYFALWLIWRVIVPFLLRRYFRKMERRFSEYARKSGQKMHREPGEVVIENIPEPEQSNNPKEGEYVDFEEIIEDSNKKS
jgi:membrane protein implicated in regulation of membrane protease activity